MTNTKRTKIQEQVQSIVNNIYYCYNTSPDVISVIARFVDVEKDASDTIKNIFHKFLEHKIQFDKITKSTISLYKYRIKSVFSDNLNIIL